MITNEAREFLQHLLEVNSARVQNDVLNRIQESRDRLEVEIRKLLHEISRIAEQALERARKIKEDGAPAVQSAVERLNRFEQDVLVLVSSNQAVVTRRPALDQGVCDEKIVAYATANPRFANIDSYKDVQAHILREIEHFFSEAPRLRAFPWKRRREPWRWLRLRWQELR